MYRKENKYLISSKNVIELTYRLKSILKLDKNVKNNDFYNVRSLYFDDAFDTSLNQVLDGVSYRYKYRIRYYNFDEDYIILEKKYKENDLTKKISCRVTKEQVMNIINNKNLIINKNNPKLLNELYKMKKLYGLKPVIIVDYKRTPYIYRFGDIRITIDSDIYCSSDINNFFSQNIIRVPLNNNHESILEVKYNYILPDFIRYLLQFNEITRSSFSKYKNSRLIIKNYNGGI